jgi:hypothetical protein
MRSKEDIKKRIKRVPVNINTRIDKEVLGDILNVLEKSRRELPASSWSDTWRPIMKNNITKLAAAAFVVALLVGVCQIDSTRTAFAHTTKVVSTGLAGLKAFILDMKTREPELPSAVSPADSSKQEDTFVVRSIQANVRTISVEGEQQDLQYFFETEGIEMIPAGNNSNTWYTRIDPDQTERFINLAQTADGLRLISAPSLMVAEGHEGIIGIDETEGQDAVALSLAAAIEEDSDSVDLSFCFLHGQDGFEIPSLRISTDDAVLFRLVTTESAQNEQDDQDRNNEQNDILVLVQVRVFSQN